MCDIRLLFVVNTLSFFLSHRYPIAEKALQEGYEVHVACSVDTPMDDLQSHGLYIHPIPLHRSSISLFSNAVTFFYLLHLFIKLRPNIVHLVTIKPIIFGGLAARVTAIPAVVASISGLGFIYTSDGFMALCRKKFVNLAYRIALSHSNINVIFQNDEDRKIILSSTGLNKENTKLIKGSGVDLDRYAFSPMPSGIPIVAFIARLLKDKGLLEFLKAAEEFAELGISARFIVVGQMDTDNPASVTWEVLNPFIKNQAIEFWGHRDNINDIIRACSIVVLPSYREGFPKTLMEAAACGRPIVTTDVPGCRDAIIDGKSGVLVPPKNIKALRNAIANLIRHPKNCTSFGKAGRALAETEFDINFIVAKHMSLYSSMLNCSIISAPDRTE